MFEATEGEPISDPARAAVIDTELAQVVELARGGDTLAFRELFQKYNGQVCTYLARLVGNDEVGRDLAQETFMRAWKSLPEIRSDAHFKAWLFRIATNIAMSHLRHARLVRWLPWQEGMVSHVHLCSVVSCCSLVRVIRWWGAMRGRIRFLRLRTQTMVRFMLFVRAMARSTGNTVPVISSQGRWLHQMIPSSRVLLMGMFMLYIKARAQSAGQVFRFPVVSIHRCSLMEQ